MRIAGVAVGQMPDDELRQEAIGSQVPLLRQSHPFVHEADPEAPVHIRRVERNGLEAQKVVPLGLFQSGEKCGIGQDGAQFFKLQQMPVEVLDEVIQMEANDRGDVAKIAVILGRKRQKCEASLDLVGRKMKWL